MDLLGWWKNSSEKDCWEEHTEKENIQKSFPAASQAGRLLGQEPFTSENRNLFLQIKRKMQIDTKHCYLLGILAWFGFRAVAFAQSPKPSFLVSFFREENRFLAGINFKRPEEALFGNQEN